MKLVAFFYILELIGEIGGFVFTVLELIDEIGDFAF